ncbi:hypothetical protein [Caballeronia sp. NCTM1]|uniref:hypothetical protein n=1 Tax=Caballeronia sp. NCTM1 TaxID=2921753 RepID=UPI0020287EFE|nr:hypothetical protein [Caballeronia sp. NCTM1]
MSTPANFPDVGAPLTDPKTGRVSTVWLQLLIALFKRSGGTSGDTPSGDAAQIAELFQQIGSLAPAGYSVDLAIRIADVEAALSALATSLRESEPESFVPTHGIQDAADLHAVATQTANGFMSSADKAKLDGMSATVEDKFFSGTGFTAGTTTSLTLSKAYASPASVTVHFDGLFQGSDQYTISGNTITFTSAIPVGTQTVYARG